MSFFNKNKYTIILGLCTLTYFIGSFAKDHLFNMVSDSFFTSESADYEDSVEVKNVDFSGTYSGYGSYDPACDCTPKISISISSTSWSGDVWNEDWNTQIAYNLYGTVSGSDLFDQYGNHVGKVEGNQLTIDFYGETQYLSK